GEGGVGAGGGGDLVQEEQIPAPELAFTIDPLEGFAYCLLEIVAALIGGIDAAESRLDRQPRQRCRPLFLPRRAVQERGVSHEASSATIMRQDCTARYTMPQSPMTRPCQRTEDQRAP